MNFEIVGEITDVETIAAGSGIREVARLRRSYGRGTWRKLKGVAQVQLGDGRIRLAELHWYEAHGIGKRETIPGLEMTETQNKIRFGGDSSTRRGVDYIVL